MRPSVLPRLAVGTLLAALAACAAAQSPPQAAAASRPASAPGASAPASAASAATGGGDGKDVVLDSQAPSTGARVSDAAGRPTTPGSAPARPASAAAATPAIYTSATHDAATAAALGDLGMALLQQQSRLSGRADVNAVYSPVSVATALGLVHAGSAGDAAREIATLLSTGPAAQQGFTARLPSVLARLRGGAGESNPLATASRVWVRKDLSGALPVAYTSLLRTRYASDGASIALEDAEAARRTINQWTSDSTRQRIGQLLPAGSLTPTTKIVITNAVHFRSPWAQAFDPKATAPRTFHAPGGDKQVATMIDERVVRRGTLDNLDVIEVPFAGQAYALLIAMTPAGHTLNALESDLNGLDIAAWSGGLRETTCRLELPKFSIEGTASSLKAPLQALGVRTVFTDAADLKPMLGPSAAGAHVDDVIHSATIVIDERGGEASASTAATVQAKSFSPPAPACAIDRPFVFAVVHRATGAPVFLGKVADPSAPAAARAN